MKRIFTILAAVFLTATLWAQSPEKMSYQAVIRDASDNLATNQTIGMQISILQGSASGTVVYTETQTPTTNANGLVSIEIGGEAGFSDIDWANDTYFIKTETDPTGGTDYKITGTSQLLSVPYALHAKTAETVTGGITESDPVYTVSEAANITAIDITNLGNLSGTNTGDQDLSSLATKTALDDSIAQIRSEIPIAISDLTMNANSQNITNIAEPTNAQDAATKAYVDALEAKLTVLELKVDLSAGASVSDLIAAGASVSDLIAAGASVSDLVAAGATNESDYIGLTYQGGIIFYVDVDGTGTGIGTGLIASTADQSTGIQWYNGSYTTTGATETALGTGNANTNTIVDSQGTGSYAAQLCADLSEGGYDDWYLPSQDELNKLYSNQTAVGSFASAYYWSSTEFNNFSARVRNFGYGGQGIVNKNSTYCVRAIRAF